MAGWPLKEPFLHFLAFELGRGPDGRWWVLGDRTQAPSGAGFALENRVATGRALSDHLATMNVHRLAGFFRDLRSALFGLVGPAGGGVAILTPGQRNETYFEHAYIARYLGLPLLEGGDLTVADGRVMVRTVEGPRAVSVLWRRLDSAFLDPLELRPESRIGTPGLLDAIRRGGATVVNAIGSGILETRALFAFLPRICRKLTGEDLALPHIATWWCGDDGEREHVLGNLDRMMIGPALATLPPFDDSEGTRLAASLEARAKAALRERLQQLRRALCGAGIGDAFDHAVLCRGQAAAAPGDAPRLCRPHAARGGRSCPAALPGSAHRPTIRRSPCRRAAGRPMSGS